MKKFRILGAIAACAMAMTCSLTSFAAEYTVVHADNLSKIAKKVYGDSREWKTIFDANKNLIKNPNLIRPGWVLTIPELDSEEAVVETPVVEEAVPVVEEEAVPVEEIAAVTTDVVVEEVEEVETTLNDSTASAEFVDGYYSVVDDGPFVACMIFDTYAYMSEEYKPYIAIGELIATVDFDEITGEERIKGIDKLDEDVELIEGYLLSTDSKSFKMYSKDTNQPIGDIVFKVYDKDNNNCIFEYTGIDGSKKDFEFYGSIPESWYE